MNFEYNFNTMLDDDIIADRCWEGQKDKLPLKGFLMDS